MSTVKHCFLFMIVIFSSIISISALYDKNSLVVQLTDKNFKKLVL